MLPVLCKIGYYLEDSIFILKIQDNILSCIFKVLFKRIFISYLQILFKSILTKRKILFEGTFNKILFVHCETLHSNYITTIYKVE